jgi:hypothetical protein
MNMIRNASKTEDRVSAQPTGPDAQRAPAFKPVALPALTAAMRAVRSQPHGSSRNDPPRDLPAILRKEATHG